MSERIHTECGLLNNEDPENTGIDETTLPISPSKAGDETWENHAHEYDNLDVMTMLVNDDWIIIQIGDVCPSNSIRVLQHYHPPDVGIQQALSDGIGIFVCVGTSKSVSTDSGIMRG